MELQNFNFICVTRQKWLKTLFKVFLITETNPFKHATKVFRVDVVVVVYLLNVSMQMWIMTLSAAASRPFSNSTRSSRIVAIFCTMLCKNFSLSRGHNFNWLRWPNMPTGIEIVGMFFNLQRNCTKCCTSSCFLWISDTNAKIGSLLFQKRVRTSSVYSKSTLKVLMASVSFFQKCLE